MTPNIMIHWCEICNHAPSDGVLEVIRRGETEIDFMQACQSCVDNLKDDDWI
jgi:hypothetical protein